jgi:hypothetical protein
MPSDLMFLTTCRQIYSEARFLQFKVNDFKYVFRHSLRQAFLQKRQLLPTQMAAISALEIDGYTARDTFLGALPNLKRVRMLCTHPPYSPCDRYIKPEYIKGVIRKSAGIENLEIDILIVHLKDYKVRSKRMHLQLRLSSRF